MLCFICAWGEIAIAPAFQGGRSSGRVARPGLGAAAELGAAGTGRLWGFVTAPGRDGRLSLACLPLHTTRCGA